MYKKFILALSETRCNWVVSRYTEEAGCCSAPYTMALIHCEYEDHNTIGFCKECTKEVCEIFEKYGFTVQHDYESTVVRPLLEIIFP